jgi:hypothetical protein
VKVFRLTFFVGDGTDAVANKLRSHLCALLTLLNFGQRRYQSIWNAAMSLAVLPDHKSTGKKNYNAIENNEHEYLPLKDHFEYLKNLREVGAT